MFLEPLLCLADVRDVNWQFEVSNRRYFGWSFFLVGILVVILVIGPREQFSGDAGAAIQRAELRMIDHCTKAIFCGGCIRTGFAAYMNCHGSSGGSVLGVIVPGFRRAFFRDIARLQCDWRVAGTIQALRAFWAEAQAPRGICSHGEQEHRVMSGLRRGRPDLRSGLLLVLGLGLT